MSILIPLVSPFDSFDTVFKIRLLIPSKDILPARIFISPTLPLPEVLAFISPPLSVEANL
ncbi:MAG: hypothetical protein HC917_24695 [Richelia sp. SM2_1_7]|nr:hypothetical protein [Richelia sp. SM2_1_7]